VLVNLYVGGPHTRHAEAALVRDPDWAAPLLWRSEFRNAVVTSMRQRDLPVEDAIETTEDAEEYMNGREYTIVSHRVLHLAMRSGCSAYDCEFVALAQDLGAVLVTTDRAILRAFPSVAVALAEFARA
jgi:predicted nucleic acid-binding protein